MLSHAVLEAVYTQSATLADRLATPEAPRNRLHTLRTTLSPHIVQSTMASWPSPLVLALKHNPALPPEPMPYDSRTPRDHTHADRRGPLPAGAIYHLGSDHKIYASIPDEWPLMIPQTQMVVSDGSILHRSYTAADVSRHMPLSVITNDIRDFAVRECHASISSVTLFRDVFDDLGSRTLQQLPSSATAQSADLFNVAAGAVASETPSRSHSPCRQRLLVLITKGRAPNLPDGAPNLPVDDVELPNVPPPPPAPPPQPPLDVDMRDALQRALARANQGAGNVRPIAPSHNHLASQLLGAQHPAQHPPTANLPTDSRYYRRLQQHLEAVEQQPLRVCYNCAMMNYKAAGDTIVIPANGREDLRAWRVFEGAIETHAAAYNVTVDDVFKCETVDARPGHRRVFTCGYCHTEKARDPTRYDLFDGVTQRTTTGFEYDEIETGQPVPAAFAALTSEERLALSIVKVCILGSHTKLYCPTACALSSTCKPPSTCTLAQMADAAFSPAYSSSGYEHFSGGAFLQPGDFHGLATVLVRNEAPPGLDAQRLSHALQVCSSAKLHYLLPFIHVCLLSHAPRPLSATGFVMCARACTGSSWQQPARARHSDMLRAGNCAQQHRPLPG